MFTGLIADLGSVAGVERDGDGATLEISTTLADQLADGDSVAVNGVCLTATAVHDGVFRAQAMQETLRRSSLERLRAGSRVNLELALRADGRLGGHIVQGHVDGTGAIVAAREEGFARVLEIEVSCELARYLVEKGSVAVDGVSLTVSEIGSEGEAGMVGEVDAVGEIGMEGEIGVEGEVGAESFSVSLIPETLARTNLGEAQVGDWVNIEVDILAKHVERLLNTEARI